MSGEVFRDSLARLRMWPQFARRLYKLSSDNDCSINIVTGNVSSDESVSALR